MTDNLKSEDMVLEDETLRSEGTRRATGEERRGRTSRTVRNEESGPNPKGSSESDVTGYEHQPRSFTKGFNGMRCMRAVHANGAGAGERCRRTVHASSACERCTRAVQASCACKRCL